MVKDFQSINSNFRIPENFKKKFSRKNPEKLILMMLMTMEATMPMKKMMVVFIVFKVFVI